MSQIGLTSRVPWIWTIHTSAHQFAAGLAVVTWTPVLVVSLGGGVWMASGGELQAQVCRVSYAVRSHLGAVHLTECKMMHRRWMSWGEIAGATGVWSQMTNVQSGSSWWMENRYSNWWSTYHTQTQYRFEGVSTSETLIQRWNNICRQSCFELMLCLINHYKAEIFVYKSWSPKVFFNMKSP